MPTHRVPTLATAPLLAELCKDANTRVLSCVALLQGPHYYLTSPFEPWNAPNWYSLAPKAPST